MGTAVESLLTKDHSVCVSPIGCMLSRPGLLRYFKSMLKSKLTLFLQMPPPSVFTFIYHDVQLDSYLEAGSLICISYIPFPVRVYKF